MKPQWHPYLFIIFFATLFEYNLHRFVTVITNKAALNSDKHQWVKKNLKAFYSLVFVSIASFIFVAFLAKKEVLIALAPIALITVFYSIPLYGNRINIFRLRDIPYSKIFLISFVWSASTVFLPIIQSSLTFNKAQVVILLAERFFFVFAITIPFDIRDIDADKQAGIKTIPLLLDKDDKVKFFSLGPHRIFTHNRAILGRDVRMCHPPSSVHVVEQILNDFRSGKENSAAFWINMHERFIYIEYFAMHGKDGEYQGTIEFTQDLTNVRKLEGEQRLLSYAKE
jgi:hypothetical protein